MTMVGPGERCGTTAGHARHIKQKEKPCDACATAKREYDKRRLEADALIQRNRLSAKAQRRALMRLSHDYPDLYREYYNEAKDAIFAEAGIDRRWGKT